MHEYHIGQTRLDLERLVAEMERLRKQHKAEVSRLHAELHQLGVLMRRFLGERDEACQWARRLQGERDRWHNAATVLSVEFAKADDQRIAACEELKRLREITPTMPELTPEEIRGFEE